MKLSTIVLYVFFIASFVATLGCSLESNSLLLLGKPIVVPSLIFYYFIESKKKMPLVFLIFAFNFIGESIGLFDFSSELTYIIVPFFCANIFILYFIYTTGKFKNVGVLNTLIIGFILIILFYFWYFIYSLFLDRNFLFVTEIGVYGLSLVSIGVLATYKLMLSINTTSNYLMIYATTLIISGTFYVLYYYQYPIKVLDIIHFACQMMSHLFLVLFILNQENYMLKRVKK
jgi:hypothetical protein